MKSQFQSRPLSKNVQGHRPTSRHINIEQAQNLFKLGKVEQSKGDFEKALELYVRATMYNPSYFQAYCNMGSCYRSLGRYSQARLNYRKSISIKRDDAISHYNLGNIERVIGNYQQSIEQYDYVIKLKEQKGVVVGNLYLDSLVNIGICYKNYGQFQKAMEYYQRASQLDPNDQGALFNHAMCLMAVLEKKNLGIFQQVSKERAAKAEVLFSNTLKINPTNQMARLGLLQLSYLFDQDGQNLKKKVEELKQFGGEEGCMIKDEINEQIGYCLNLLKQYEQSAKFYQNSMKNLNQRKQSVQNPVNIYDIPGSIKTETNFLPGPISEEEGIKLIDNGEGDLLLERLASLEDSNITKHVLQLALWVSRMEQSQVLAKRAEEVFEKWFVVDGKEIPFEQISIEGHKAVGRWLSSQGRYKESILHFQHISKQIKGNEENANLHNSIGQNYAALGEKEKALQYYKVALELQPQNYTLVYNVGFSLRENSLPEQSMHYFQKFISLVQRDQQLNYESKGVYIADCLITMCTCLLDKPGELALHQRTLQKLKEIDQQQTAQGVAFQPFALMSFYLRLADLLQEAIGKLQRSSEEYRRSKQQLLQVYGRLLQLEDCPDRNAILNNCGNMYYESKMYLNSVEHYLSVTEGTASYCNIALCYLHIFQHVLASKYIFLAIEQEPSNPLVRFNFEVINWIYSISTEGRLYDKYPNFSEDLLLYRLEYGFALIDKLTLVINQQQNIGNEEIERAISQILENDSLPIFEEEGENIKFRYISKNMKESIANNPTEQGDPLPEEIVRLSMGISGRADDDFRKLVALLRELPKSKKDISILQATLSLFVLVNRNGGEAIKRALRELVHLKSHSIHLNMDKKVSISEDILGVDYEVQSIEGLVEILKDWECGLESKLVVLVKYIQKCYYQTSIRAPLQVEHHFPRHFLLRECDLTLSKIAHIANKVLKTELRFEPKGTTLKSMKNGLIKDLEAALEKRLRNQAFSRITLSQEFLPITLYTFHRTREDCFAFLELLQRESHSKAKPQVSGDCDELVVIVGGLLRLHCQWSDQNSLLNTLKSLLESPVGLINQAVISLENEVQVLREESKLASQMLEELDLFKL